MFLENKYIKLRALEPSDLEILYKWENSASLWIHGNTLSPYSRQALRHYINEAQLYDIYQNKQLRLMVDVVPTNETVGIVDLYDFDVRNRRAGVGILVEEQHRCKGYASQSLELIEDYAFSFLGLHQLYAFISVNNKLSSKLFEKSGYRYTGTLRNWIQLGNEYEDVHVMQLINNNQDNE